MNKINNTDNFITTTDRTTALALKNQGFQSVQISDIGSAKTYYFLNKSDITFSNEIDISKVRFTNMLCI